MIGTVLIPNGIAIILLLVLISSANVVSQHIRLLDSKIFYLMVICNIIQCVGEVIAYAIDGEMIAGFYVLILIVNSILFVVNILFSFLWVLYADCKIYDDADRLKRRGKIFVIPALAVIAGVMVNFFFPVFFRVTKENSYERTNLYLLPYAVTYFYLAYGTVFIYRHKSQARKYVFLPAIIFMVPIVIGSEIQFFFYGVSTVWVGTAIGLVAVYVNVQNEVSYIDGLSGLYTRLYMYQFLESAIKKKYSNKRLAGIMLDIDEFKKINDTYGHLTGDDAIRSAGKILRNTISNKGVVVRYGGDEFVVLLYVKTEEDVKDALKAISTAEEVFNNSKGKQYALHFSQGYSIMDTEEDTVDAFLGRMDKAMYEVKKTRKLKR